MSFWTFSGYVASYWEKSKSSSDHSRTNVRARLVFRNHPFKFAIFQGVVFHMDVALFDFRIKAWTVWHLPTLQRAFQFQTNIIIQPTGIVLLNDP